MTFTQKSREREKYHYVSSIFTFLPHMAKAMRPPSSSPAGMLLMALIRRPAQAHKTSGFTDSCVPSFRASPSSSFAVSRKRLRPWKNPLKAEHVHSLIHGKKEYLCSPMNIHKEDCLCNWEHKLYWSTYQDHRQETIHGRQLDLSQGRVHHLEVRWSPAAKEQIQERNLPAVQRLLASVGPRDCGQYWQFW